MSIMSLLLGTSSGISYGPTPTIDGSASGSASSTTPVFATLSTTLTNNIIVAIVSVEGSGITGSTTIAVTGGGLTWTKYTSNFYAAAAVSGYSNLQDVWYATATSVVSAQSITGTCSTQFDDATIVVFGVNGCNLAAPFDTGTNMPINTTFGISVATKTVTGINTKTPNPLIIASWTVAINDALNTLDTGYTQIAYVQNGGATRYMYNFVEYKSVTGVAQVNTTHNGATGTSRDTWGCTVFAMTG
jgi:hypothetical protein